MSLWKRISSYCSNASCKEEGTPAALAYAAAHRIAYGARGSQALNLYTIDEYQEATGLRYLPQLEFANNRTYEAVRRQGEAAASTGSIDAATEQHSIRYREEVAIGFVNAVIIRWVDDRIGWGLFATADIAAEDFIGQYTGIVRRWLWLEGHLNEYCYRYPWRGPGTWSLYTYTIDAKDAGNETCFMNHSLQPNCESFAVYTHGIFRVGIRTIRPIAAGEELTYDYGKMIDNVQAFYRE